MNTTSGLLSFDAHSGHFLPDPGPHNRDPRVDLWLAALIQEEHRHILQMRATQAIDPLSEAIYFRLRELYWTVTRMIGLGHLHDGSRPAKSKRRRRPPLPADAGLKPVLPLSGSNRLFIDATPTHRNGGQTGIQRVVREVARRAVKTGFALPVIVENGALISWFDGPGSSDPIVFAPGDRFVLLDACWDLVDEYAPIIDRLRAAGGSIVSVVHDLIPLTHPLAVSPGLQAAFRDWFERVVMDSEEILCISRSAATDFLVHVSNRESFAAEERRIGWWRLGADFTDEAPGPVSAAAQAAFADDKPCFLSVGTLEPRKAYPVALDAFEALWRNGVDARYLIVGRPGWQSEALAHRIRSHPELGRRLFWLDVAGDADLRFCYRRAHALVSPSILEGFGLPLVEAGRHGLPVIAADIPVFRETGGHGVHYVPPLDPQGLAERVAALCREPVERGAFAPTTWDQATENLFRLLQGGDAWQPSSASDASPQWGRFGGETP